MLGISHGDYPVVSCCYAREREECCMHGESLLLYARTGSKLLLSQRLAVFYFSLKSHARLAVAPSRTVITRIRIETAVHSYSISS